jgi:hypothetical protein
MVAIQLKSDFDGTREAALVKVVMSSKIKCNCVMI